MTTITFNPCTPTGMHFLLLFKTVAKHFADMGRLRWLMRPKMHATRVYMAQLLNIPVYIYIYMYTLISNTPNSGCPLNMS